MIYSMMFRISIRWIFVSVPAVKKIRGCKLCSNKKTKQIHFWQLQKLRQKQKEKEERQREENRKKDT